MKDSTKSKAKDFLHFIYWVVIYSVLFLVLNFILPDVFGSYKFFSVSLLHFLLYGLCFSILSQVVYGLIYDNRIYIDSGVFFFWTFAYGLSIWFSDYVKNLFVVRLNFILLNNIFIEALFFGLCLFFLIKIVQKIDFGFSGNKRGFKAPSQIFTGVILLIIGILCWRFSTIVFIDWFNWAEGLGWSMLLGFGFIIAGVLVLVAWWRNNVLQHRIGIKFGHW